DGDKVFRYIDDFLVFIASGIDAFKAEAAKTLTTFRERLGTLDVTHEMPVDNTIRFLHIRLLFLDDHICRCYEPRANKPLLPFHSAHSKLVKRGIVNLCFTNALKKSCEHLTSASFEQQVQRLTAAGYPKHILVSVAEGLLGKHCLEVNTRSQQAKQERKVNVVVIPYIHRVSHNLKKIAMRSNVKVVFSAPNKLMNLYKLTKPDVSAKRECKKRHRTKFVDCTGCVIYRIPLSCGKQYVGQTGRCLNDRLREHCDNVQKHNGGFLDIHCRACGCAPLFDRCVKIGKDRATMRREIVEAERIDHLGDTCVAMLSTALSDQELAFLRTRP
ncbi:unnamed protein product, partial [Ixodes hexagonus]